MPRPLALTMVARWRGICQLLLCGCLCQSEAGEISRMLVSKQAESWTTEEAQIYRPPPAQASAAQAAVNYVLAPVNSNECVGSAVKLSSLAACKAAAGSLGLVFQFDEVEQTFPAGCYKSEKYTNGVFFNSASPGAPQVESSLICEAAGVISTSSTTVVIQTPAPTSVGPAVASTTAVIQTPAPSTVRPTVTTTATVSPMLASCHEAIWPDAKRVCGECKVLVGGIRSYGTCTSYCRNIGLSCVEDLKSPNGRVILDKADTCTGEIALSCTQPADADDMICHCSGEFQTVIQPLPTFTTTSLHIVSIPYPTEPAPTKAPATVAPPTFTAAPHHQKPWWSHLDPSTWGSHDDDHPGPTTLAPINHQQTGQIIEGVVGGSVVAAAAGLLIGGLVHRKHTPTNQNGTAAPRLYAGNEKSTAFTGSTLSSYAPTLLFVGAFCMVVLLAVLVAKRRRRQTLTTEYTAMQRPPTPTSDPGESAESHDVEMAPASDASEVPLLLSTETNVP